MCDWFSNVSVVNKHAREDVLCSHTKRNLNNYGTAVVLLADLDGLFNISSINGVLLPDHIKHKLNITPRRMIGIEQIRYRLDRSLETDAKSETFYTLLANLVSLILPSYVVLKKEVNKPIQFKARIIEDFVLSPTIPHHDLLRQSALTWSERSSDSHLATFDTVIPYNGYAKNQDDFVYKVSNDIRSVGMRKFDVRSNIADFIKPDSFPILPSHLREQQRQSQSAQQPSLPHVRQSITPRAPL